MKLILGGTSDTHRYIEENGGEYIISVATDYGYALFSKKYQNVVHIRFDEIGLKDFIKAHGITEIVDTSHPFARLITALAEKICAELSLPYINAMRNTDIAADYENIHFFDCYEDAVFFIKHNDFKSVLLTTGANHIDKFAEIADRCTARVLPYEKSIEKCRASGFEYRNIIGMQGPFSVKFNTALMQEIKADALVTKMSGDSGGINEKIESCKETKAACIIITGG